MDISIISLSYCFSCQFHTNVFCVAWKLKVFIYPQNGSDHKHFPQT